MTDFDRVERALGEANFAKLQAAKVAIIGCGSGGSFVADALAASGVKNFVLVDPAELKPANVTRHVGNRYDIGVLKVEIVEDRIMGRDQTAKVLMRAGDFKDNVGSFYGVDLFVVCVDSEKVKFQVNELALEFGIPAIYAGVYERGEGGDVCLIRPDSGPCYACWAEQMRDLTTPVESHQQADYGAPAGSLRAEPGLWTDIVRVASMQAWLAIEQLCGNVSDRMPNTIITANRMMELVAGEGQVMPFTTEWINVGKLQDCLVCDAPTVPLNTEDINDILE